MKEILAIDFIKEKVKDSKIFEDYYLIYKKMEKATIKNTYKIGDNVVLKKDSLLHGIKSFDENKIDSIKKNGFLFGEYFKKEVSQQKYCVCFWIMNDEIKLKDYINNYSAETIHLQNRITKKYKQIYIPYNFDVKDRQALFKKINNFIYSIVFVRDSKENQFLPSLNKQDDYIGFILDNSYTDIIKKYDIYNGCLSLEELSSFLPEWVINKTIKKKMPTQTDHELSIIYGLPSNLIEGVIVGKIIERDKNKIKYLKTRFPNCYICNLNGKVIF